MQESIQTRLLSRAAEIAGGPYMLAQLLGVQEATLVAWMQDEAVPPARVFLSVIELTVLSDCRTLGTAEAVRRLAADLTSALEQRDYGLSN